MGFQKLCVNSVSKALFLFQHINAPSVHDEAVLFDVEEQPGPVQPTQRK